MRYLGILITYFFMQSSMAGNDTAYLGECAPNEKTITQSFVIDNRTNESFGQTLKNISKNPDVFAAIISHYPGKIGVLRAKNWTNPLEVIGHQGLAIQYINSERYFWGALNENYSSDSGVYAIRYRLEGGALNSIEFFKVFADRNTTQPTSPTISADGKYLIVQMVRENEYEIRSFNLDMLSHEGDFSNSYTHHFILKRDRNKNGPYALQALASDGARIFMLMGSFKVDEINILNIYTIDGSFIESISLTSGEDRARNTGKGTHYEPEGLTWLNTAEGSELILQVAAGDGKNRSCLLYGTSIYAR
jgi:hypothetical protein